MLNRRCVGGSSCLFGEALHLQTCTRLRPELHAMRTALLLLVMTAVIQEASRDATGKLGVSCHLRQSLLAVICLILTMTCKGNIWAGQHQGRGVCQVRGWGAVYVCYNRTGGPSWVFPTLAGS